MKKVISLFVLFLMFSIISKGQTNKDSAAKNTTNIEGTYQIQVVNSRNHPYIPYNLNQLVLDNRDATQVKYVTLGTEVRIMVLPLSEINKPDFKPLKQIAHVAK
jgi:hypothetical protein